MNNIEKLPLLQCPQCGSENVFKEKSKIFCSYCHRMTDEKGKVHIIDKQNLGDGYDPRRDTDDYLEGWVTQRDD